MKSAARLVVVVLLGAAAGSACARRPPPTVPRREIRLALDAAVPTLDPTYTEGTTFLVLSNVFEPLVDYDRALHLVPALATEWATPDERTWVFTLRPQVRLHDGSLLTAEDVVAALRRAKDDPVSVARERLATVEAIDAPAPGRVRIRTSGRDPLLLHQLVSVLVAKGATRAAIERNPVGSGPYRVTRWTTGTGALLEAEAFPGAWRGAPQIARVRFEPVPTGAARISALRERTVDVAAVPPGVVPLKGRGFRVVDSPGLTTDYLFIATGPEAGRENPLRERGVRQAMSLAIDRRALARKIVGHEGAFASQLVPASIFGYAAALPPPPFDPAAARALLGKAYRLPLDLTLVHRDGPAARELAEALKRMLDAAGFRVTLRALSWPDLIAASDAQRVPLFLSRWVFDNGDAGSFLVDCLRSRHPPSPDGVHNAGYSNPEMDRLIDESRTVFDDHLRLGIFERVMSLAREEVPLIPLLNEPDVWGLADDLDWQPRLDGRLLVSEMGFRPGR